MVLTNRHWVIEEGNNKLSILPFKGIHRRLWFGISIISFGLVCLLGCTTRHCFSYVLDDRELCTECSLCIGHFLSCDLRIVG